MADDPIFQSKNDPKQETWQNYGEYQTAVFQPGLSPEQRRLLFDAAIEKLSLPLPGGERIP